MDTDPTNINSWEDYWKAFDSYKLNLENSGKNFISHELKDAQLFVNGLTDGWYDFMIALDTISARHTKTLSEEENTILNQFKEIISKSLKNR